MSPYRDRSPLLQSSPPEVDTTLDDASDGSSRRRPPTASAAVGTENDTKDADTLTVENSSRDHSVLSTNPYTEAAQRNTSRSLQSVPLSQNERRQQRRQLLLSPHTAEPPSILSQLKKEAEEEEREAQADENDEPVQSLLTEEEARQLESQSAPRRGVSPGGVEYYEGQPSAKSYDEPADQQEDLSESELDKELKKLQEKKAKRMRRQERAARIEQLRGELKAYVKATIANNPNPPQDLVQLLREADLFEQKPLHWVSAGKTDRSVNRSHNRSTNGAPAPLSASALPQPTPQYGRSASGQSLDYDGRPRSSGVRIPSTRFEPTIPLYVPRTSTSRSKSRERGKATWKPPCSVRQEPLGIAVNPIVERLRKANTSNVSQGSPKAQQRGASTANADGNNRPDVPRLLFTPHEA